MGTYVIGAIVLMIIGLVVKKLFKDRKDGKGCGSGCGGCTKCPGNAPVEK